MLQVPGRPSLVLQLCSRWHVPIPAWVETTTICVEHGQFRKHLHHARYTDGFLPHTSRTLPRPPYRVVSLVPLTTVCQTFSLKVTRHHIDGSTSLTKSVPCGLSGLEICIVEVSGAYTCGHEASQARGSCF